MNTKPAATDAYLARAAAIHIKLARLQQLADDHFGHNQDATLPGSKPAAAHCRPPP